MSTFAKLWFLHCGWLIEPAEDDTKYRIQVPAYLIESATGKRYLVDTGNPKSLIGATNCGPWYHAEADIGPEDDPIARLAKLGLQPSDIDAVIATHFDFDHAGRYDVFGPLGTDVWVQRAQIRSALSEPDRYDSALWKIPGLRWQQLDGDHELEPGITLLRTDGHAVGHQSLLIEMETGPVILAIDACDSAETFASREFPDYFDVPTTNASIDRLKEISERTGAPIIFGHDPKQWATLPMSPTPYSRSASSTNP
jgi:N-acyl homoserine lactone hydrolase